jgi:MFS family permease
MDSSKLSKKHIMSLCFLVMGQQMVSEITFPFIPFMVQSFNITTSNKIGYYAGFVTSAFGLAQIISSVIFGILSDRYGRKIFLLLGALGNVITMPLFGLSKTYYEALCFRALCGLASANSSVIRAVIGDITNDKTAPLAWSYWGMSAALGRMGRNHKVFFSYFFRCDGAWWNSSRTSDTISIFIW